MEGLKKLLDQNRAWAQEMTDRDPDFFSRLVRQQAPRYLWIGCSDSRVPANQIVGLLPGEMFVHRNVANVVVHTDLNCLSTIQYAIDALEVEHIIVVGHYGCGGVLDALLDTRTGLAVNWLRHVQDVLHKHRAEIDAIPSAEGKLNRLCELNVLDQVSNVAETTVVRDAWARDHKIAVHGWIYDLRDGLIRDLGLTITNETQIP